METESNKQIINNISNLIIKYKDNEYILSRLSSFINNLPNMLDGIDKKHEENIIRINELNIEQKNFFNVFLNKHQYYYMSHNNLYYEYNGVTYSVIREDHINHILLSSITKDGKLMPWKHKTKQNVMKQIKDRNLFKSVPETTTIQNVLGFLQTIFKTKTECKYFLTVIGDCILKKNTDSLLFVVSLAFKKIIGLIDSIVYITCGTSIINSFISKYHDTHNISLFRLINTNTMPVDIDVVKQNLNNIGLDLLCVATHYSERYTNSDNYLMTQGDDISNHIMYFKHNNTEEIIKSFISQYIEQVNKPSAISAVITWKSMDYIWKHFLSKLCIPNMLYSQQLQQQLTQLLAHKGEGNSIVFTDITSKFLPHVGSFLLFWENHITITNGQEQWDDDEYEIDEFSTLYKLSTNQNSQTNITETEMIQMIHHYFYPQVEIIDNKYITNIRCDLWLKEDNLNDFLTMYKTNLVSEQMNELGLISFNNLYDQYTTHSKAKNEKIKSLVVSKLYFEKYLINSHTEYIRFDTFICLDTWVKS